MTSVDLLASGGDDVADAALRGIVGLFELVFPGLPRSYFLQGSRADGTAVSTSDLDVRILFAGDLTGEELARARALAAHCKSLSAIALDLSVSGERPFLDFGDARLKHASLLIYGADVRDVLPPASVELAWRAAMYGERRLISRVRGDPHRLQFPLGYPDPDGEFFGYDRRRIRTTDGVIRATTKDLVRTVSGAAGAFACRASRQQVLGKGEAVRLYRETIGDGWTKLIEDVDRTCRVEFAYLIPDHPADRARLRSLCARALDLENHFLTTFRDVLRADREHPPDVPPEAEWLPVDSPTGMRATFFLESTPEEVRELVAAGELPASEYRGHLVVSTARCLQLAAARMLNRVM